MTFVYSLLFVNSLAYLVMDNEQVLSKWKVVISEDVVACLFRPSSGVDTGIYSLSIV